MNGLTVVFGNGAIGHLVTDTLASRGDRVRIAQRNRPAELARGVEFVATDILDGAAVRRAVEGASQVLMSVGFAYDSRLWRTVWPKAMRNMIEACADVGARVVFIDNLYQLGPQDNPRTEEMSLTTVGQKPAILAEVTRIWMDARDRVRFAALRCPDFYGPGVIMSHLGSSAFGEMAKGKTAQMMVPIDIPHDFAYAPDIARAAVTLLDAPDDAFGQVWNMPCAPTLTPRQILQLGADAIAAPVKIMALPFWTMPVLGLFMRMAKEIADVDFTWTRPFHVDASKFKRRFWSDVTPFEIGAAATVRSFMPAAATTFHG